jgi:hypothetical protein
MVRVGEREELRECFRGMRGGTAGEGGVVRVLERREGRWECRRGRGGEGAGEGGMLRVLEREGWWKCWRGGGSKGGVVRDEERFASFTAAEATFQARGSRFNRTGNTTGRNMQNGPVLPQTALSRPQIHSYFAKFDPRGAYSSNMFSCGNFSQRRTSR